MAQPCRAGLGNDLKRVRRGRVCTAPRHGKQYSWRPFARATGFPCTHLRRRGEHSFDARESDCEYRSKRAIVIHASMPCDVV
ncbi:hypothetical protein BURMUCGD2M_6148 [Burkholderia multivorans CGD2M]|uniref:Uncharacterized protein n=1 Tax=Burkholderia multivorans CGD2 TaxID=513052 RepID=B9BWS2_9BURK|nr:hypothetical protein BURMUCGD2_6159 [Burkholderia multivorans CGD2]EEE13429.1 hypothetical protein BURMUCGD2M_6148 [Burkholderia multivorans CGD2M]